MIIAHNRIMLLLAKIVLIVYLVAINVYGFLLLSTQKKSTIEETNTKISDGRLFICGLLGGALSIYVSMFILKYRLTNFFLMVIMPILIAINVYLVIFCLTQNFGIVI